MIEKRILTESTYHKFKLYTESEETLIKEAIEKRVIELKEQSLREVDMLDF